MQPQVHHESNSGLDYLQIDNQGEVAVILFHGYGASMLDLYGLGEYIKTDKNCDWYFPNGLLNLQMGMGMMARGWFSIDVQALELAMQTGTHRSFEDAYTEEFQDALNAAEKFVTEIKSKYKKLVIGGFSQGAMVSTHTALKMSDSLAGLVCYSGTLIGKKEITKLMETSTKFPFFQSHGKGDPILGYDHAKSLFELVKLGGHQGEFVSFDGAHEIPMNVIEKSTKYLNKVLN